MTSKTLSACCQPPLTAEAWTAISERMACRERQLLAVTPTRCPACGSREIAPLFWGGMDVLGCGCGAVFSGRGD
jgi:hypothetical protein